MARIDVQARTLTLKLVYHGPAMGGKTTNLKALHGFVDPAQGVELRSLETEGDRTLFFDLLPLDLGDVCGFKIKVRLFTVPGQVHYSATRRIVLQGADAVVFVADSAPERLAANRESLLNLRANLVANGIGPGVVPIVIQANKRDLPSAAPLADVEAQLGLEELEEHGRTVLPQTFAARAVHGVGVMESFAAALEAALAQAYRKHGLGRMGVVREQLGYALHEALAPLRARAPKEAEVALDAPTPPPVTPDEAERAVDVESLLAEAVTHSLDLAEALGDQAALAVALSRRVRELETINELSARLTRHLDVNEIAAALATAARAALPQGAAAVLLPDATGKLGAAALAGIDSDPFLAVGQPSLASTLHRASRPAHFADLATDLLFGDSATAFRLAPWCTAAVAPLKLARAGAGLLVAYGADPDGPAGPETARFLQSIAAQGALALQNADRHAQLVAHQGRLEQEVAARTAELRLAHQEIVAASQLKDRILSCVNHELRTPVTKLLSTAQVLERARPGAAPPPQFLATIVAQAKQLAHLVDQALSARALLAPEASDGSGAGCVDLARAVEAVAFAANERASARRVTLRVEGARGPVPVAAETGAVSLALSQLVDNAVKFSPPGGDVRVEVVAAPGGFARVTVTDDGPGVRAEDVGRIFAEFDQGSADHLVAKPQGLGLGLAIARRVARRFGGDVGVEPSAPGAGATFWIELPVHAEALAAVAS